MNDSVTRPKPDLERSEAWISALSGIGALLTAYLAHIEGAQTWVALFLCAALAGAYAFFRTPLAAKGAPGIKTKTFWTSTVVILASVTTAVSEAVIVGIPAEVTQIAGMVSAVAVALGYNVWRYRRKAKQ